MTPLTELDLAMIQFSVVKLRMDALTLAASRDPKASTRDVVREADKLLTWAQTGDMPR